MLHDLTQNCLDYNVQEENSSQSDACQACVQEDTKGHNF